MLDLIDNLKKLRCHTEEDDSFEVDDLPPKGEKITGHVRRISNESLLSGNDSFDEDSFDCLTEKLDESDESEDESEKWVECLYNVMNILHENGIAFEDYGICEDSCIAWMDCSSDVSKDFVRFMVDNELMEVMNNMSCCSVVNFPFSWDRLKESIVTVKVHCSDLDTVWKRFRAIENLT